MFFKIFDSFNRKSFLSFYIHITIYEDLLKDLKETPRRGDMVRLILNETYSLVPTWMV